MPHANLTRVTKAQARKIWNAGGYVAFSHYTNTVAGAAYSVKELGGTFDEWAVTDVNPNGQMYFYKVSE